MPPAPPAGPLPRPRPPRRSLGDILEATLTRTLTRTLITFTELAASETHPAALFSRSSNEVASGLATCRLMMSPIHDA